MGLVEELFATGQTSSDSIHDGLAPQDSERIENCRADGSAADRNAQGLSHFAELGVGMFLGIIVHNPLNRFLRPIGQISQQRFDCH